jgi:hypothetical protein
MRLVEMQGLDVWLPIMEGHHQRRQPFFRLEAHGPTGEDGGILRSTMDGGWVCGHPIVVTHDLPFSIFLCLGIGNAEIIRRSAAALYVP